MPYKLISLVILLFFLIINKAYSENEFILPVKKPSIFKKIEKNITSKKESNLPQKKPIIQTNTSEENIVKEEKIHLAIAIFPSIECSSGFFSIRKRKRYKKIVGSFRDITGFE